jgi:ComF family protein
MSAWSWLHAELCGLIDLLFPPACPLCGSESGGRPPFYFCPDCLSGIHPLGSPCCPRCALPYTTEEGSDHLCESCLRDAPPFSRVVALGIYEETLRTAVQRFKYEGAIVLDRPLAGLLATVLERDGPFRPDLLIPVPLHHSRLRERTYNQALLLARVLGRRWRQPVLPRLLVRSRPTPQQQGLKAEVRRQNLKGAFALNRQLNGERVLLIDDVVTTGATVRECSRVLLEGGAGEVVVAVLARARRYHV